MTNAAPLTRVLLVDDHVRMRRLACLLIELADQETVVTGEAGSYQEALTRRRADRPDVVVLDYVLPDGNGLVLAAEMLAEDPSQAIVLFSAALDPELEELALRVGVTACLPKQLVDDLPAVILSCSMPA